LDGPAAQSAREFPTSEQSNSRRVNRRTPGGLAASPENIGFAQERKGLAVGSFPASPIRLAASTVPLRQNTPGLPSALFSPSGVQSLAVALLANGNVNLLMAQK
jgi:hypothetical protein